MVETVTVWLDTQMDEGPREPRDVLEGDLDAVGLRLSDVRVDWSGSWFERGERKGWGAWYGYVHVTLEPEAARRLVAQWYGGTQRYEAHLGTAPR